MWSISINAYKFQQHTGLYATFYLPSTFILQIVTMSRFKYAPEQMTAALLACRSQGMGVRKAAQQYAVPRSTLNDKLLGRSPEVRKCGPVTFLTTQVEFLRILPIIRGLCCIILWQSSTLEFFLTSQPG